MYYTVRVWGAISTDFISRSDLSAAVSFTRHRRWRRPRWKPASIYTGNEALAVISAHASSRLFFSLLLSLSLLYLSLLFNSYFFSSMELFYIYIYPCVHSPTDFFSSFSSACPPPLVGKKPRRSRHHYYATTNVWNFLLLLLSLFFSLYLSVYIIMSFGPASSMSFNAFKVCNTRDPVGACFFLFFFLFSLVVIYSRNKAPTFSSPWWSPQGADK